MTLLALFGYASGVLSVVTYIPYLVDIFKGTTHPERATWFIWSILSAIAFLAQYEEGASHSLWLVGVQTVGVVVIFLLSLKYGYGGLKKRDVIALIAAAIGLVLWYLTDNPALALAFAIAIDAVGAMPTLFKAYELPESETLSTWILSGTAGIFGALAVGAWDVVLLAFPVYIVLVNYLIACAIITGRRRQSLNR